MKAYFAKLNPNAKIPSKREEDAGLDIYACFTEPYIFIYPHRTKLIPTGIASVCDKDYCFILKERGSTGTKGMAQRCGVIDSGYRGEWFVPITNTTQKPIILYNDLGTLRERYQNDIDNDCFTLYSTQKAIAQALIVPVPRTEIMEISADEIKCFNSERGEGKLGSTNVTRD